MLIKHIEIEEINLPQSQNRIVVKILSCGICISEVKVYQQEQSHYFKPSIALGYEYVGTTVNRYKNGYFKKRDRIAIVHAVNCGYCNYCQRGLLKLYKNKQRLSNEGFDQYFSMDTESANQSLIKLSENISPNESTFLEPIACCIESINLSKNAILN